MNTFLERLTPNRRRGSKPRCHLLTHGTPDAVAASLSSLAAPFALVTRDDQWMPQGFEDTDEATLPEAARLLPADVRSELKRWWLVAASSNAQTPNWDIASTCSIEGQPGLLLIEAKAHDQELSKEAIGKKNLEFPVSCNSRRNLLRIDWAMRDANIALAGATELPWALSRDWNYQMSNRFAWAWKLTELHVPVVLIYLGFLNADDIDGLGKPFTSAMDWERAVKDHSQALFPSSVWNQRLECNGQPLIPLIRSLRVSSDELGRL